jgi:hypothetical protein
MVKTDHRKMLKIGDFGAEPVEQPAARQLRQHVRPGEGGKYEAHLHRRQAEQLFQLGAGNRDGGPVGVIDGGDDEQDCQDAPPYAGGGGAGLAGCGCVLGCHGVSSDASGGLACTSTLPGGKAVLVLVGCRRVSWGVVVKLSSVIRQRMSRVWSSLSEFATRLFVLNTASAR